MPAETGLLLFGVLILLVFLFMEDKALKKAEGKTNETTGTIDEIDTHYPNTYIMSKWAKVRYFVDGKPYKSSNWMYVSNYAKVGDEVKVKYEIDSPSTLNASSKLKYNIFLYGAVILVVLSLIVWVVQI